MHIHDSIFEEPGVMSEIHPANHAPIDVPTPGGFTVSRPSGANARFLPNSQSSGFTLHSTRTEDKSIKWGKLHMQRSSSHYDWYYAALGKKFV